jgi:hypothetical protein
MSPADHLTEANRLIAKLQNVSANENPIIDAVADCLNHIVAACEQLLAHEQADANRPKVTFREFI